MSQQPAKTNRTESRCRKIGLGASLIAHLILAVCLAQASMHIVPPPPAKEIDTRTVQLRLCQLIPPAPAPSPPAPPTPKPKPRPKPVQKPKPRPEPKPAPQTKPEPKPTVTEAAPPDAEPEQSAPTETEATVDTAPAAEPTAISAPAAQPEAETSAGRAEHEVQERHLLQQLTTMITEEKYYPYTARRRNLEGQAHMMVFINRQGAITNFRIESSSSPIFHKAAQVTLKRVKKKFKPQGLHFDKAFEIRVPIAYRLMD